MSVTRRRVLGLLLLAGLVFRLQFIAHDMRDLVTRGPLYDDSFYCFEIARNIAAGTVRPSTAAGHERLPAAVRASPRTSLPGLRRACDAADLSRPGGVRGRERSDRLDPVPAGATLRFVAGRVLRPRPLELRPAIVRQAVNGLETALAMFLVAASLEYYLTVYRAREVPSGRNAATLGLLLGLAVLARIDALLFVIALAADDLVRRRHPRLAWLAVAAGVHDRRAAALGARQPEAVR
jgi:hypothetical protein